MRTRGSAKLWLLGGVAVAAVAAGAALALWPEDPPPTEDPAAALDQDEAPPTRDETEAFMREIGYVQ